MPVDPRQPNLKLPTPPQQTTQTNINCKPNKSTKPSPPISRLSKRTLFHIFLYLNPLELEQSILVCKAWYNAGTDEKQWQRYYIFRWGKDIAFYTPKDCTESFSIENCKWREAYKYREYEESLYTKGTVKIIKVYNQIDLKILMMSPTSVKQATQSKGWVDVQKEEKPLFSCCSAESPKPNEIKMVEATELEDMKTLYNDLINHHELYDYGEWIDCGFHLCDVKLLDGRICLNVRRNQKRSDKSFIRRYSYDLLVYSLISTRAIYLENEAEEQWVASVVKYSSQSPGREASNIEGMTRIFPNYGSCPLAWAPATVNGVEFIQLSFRISVYITGVDIYETCEPGAVVKVSAYNEEKNEWVVLWHGKPQQKILPKKSRIFKLKFQPTTFKSSLIQIDLDTRLNETYSEIDAVKLHGTLNLGGNEDSQKEMRLEKLKINRKNIDKDGAAFKSKTDGLDKQTAKEKDKTQTTATRSRQSTNSESKDKFENIQSKREKQAAEYGEDMLKQQKHVFHFPYKHLSFGQFDFNCGLIAFTTVESQYYHITETLMVVGGCPQFRNQIFLEVNYTRDYILKVKILNSSTVMVIIKQFKIPSTCSIHIWSIPARKLIKCYEMKECSGNSQISIWQLTHKIVACAHENDIHLYDISAPSVDNWKHIHKLSHKKPVLSLSLNNGNKTSHKTYFIELGDVCNIIASGSVDKTCCIWSMSSGKCLFKLQHSNPVCSVNLIAAGALVATCCINNSTIRIWSTTTGQLIREINSQSSQIPVAFNDLKYCFKQIYFERGCFTYFGKGQNEYLLGRFMDNQKNLIFNKYTSTYEADQTCNIL